VKIKCQVDEQNQGSKIDLQTIDLNIKVELVKETSTSYRNCRLDLQSKVQFGLLLDPKIHSSKCYIKNLQES
jgi:hypothetical protein